MPRWHMKDSGRNVPEEGHGSILTVQVQGKLGLLHDMAAIEKPLQFTPDGVLLRILLLRQNTLLAAN